MKNMIVMFVVFVVSVIFVGCVDMDMKYFNVIVGGVVRVFL